MKKSVVIWVLINVLIAAAICIIVSRDKAVDKQPNSVVTEKVGTLSGVCILVDAGHGGYDGGARAINGGLWEKEFNLQMAQQIKIALEAQGAKVIMTRTEDKAFADRKRPDLDARLQMARDGSADILISVHMNQYHDPREAGPQVFYRKNNEDSRLLAGCLQEALIHGLQPSRVRSALAGDYYMLSLPIPSVLVECGFISNPQEAKLLLDTDYQKQLAEAVVSGVTEYCRLKENAGETAAILPLPRL